MNGTGLVIENYLEVLAGNGAPALFAKGLHSLSALDHLGNGRSLVCLLHQELLLGLHITGFGPRHVLRKQELYLYKVLAVCIQLGKVIGDAVDLLHAGTVYHAVFHHGQVVLHALAVFPQRSLHGILQGHEVVLVVHLYGALLGIHHLYGHGLIDLLHLVVLRLGLAVAEDDAVHHELAVVRRVAEVAAVCQIACAVGLIVIQRLVHPVPDGTAAEEVGALNGIPIVHQVTYGITHGVGILRDVERILDAVLASHGTAHPSDGGILVGTHVHNVIVALVLHGACGVKSLECLVGGHKVLAGTGLVAQ